MTVALLLAPDAGVLAVAVALDLLFGDPPNALHPVAWLGRLVNTLLRGAPERGVRAPFMAGVALVAAALALSVLAAVALSVLLHSSHLVPSLPALLIEAAFLKATFAIRGLGVASHQVAERLRANDGVGARLALRSLCSRDAARLDESQVAAAAVESVAENVSDSVIAPLFFYLLLGLPGAVLYRAANTLDAMVGYHGRFEYLGKAAARLDDALNWLPARVTAGLLLLAGWRRRAPLRNGWRVLWRDGSATESPNAGRPMAAMAGLLEIVLEKPGHYRLGGEGGTAQAAHIRRAWLIARDAALLGSALAVAAVAWRRAGHGLWCL